MKQKLRGVSHHHARQTLILLRVSTFSLSQNKACLRAVAHLTAFPLSAVNRAHTVYPHLSSSRRSISLCCMNMRFIGPQTPRADPQRPHLHVLIRSISKTPVGFYMFIYFQGGHHREIGSTAFSPSVCLPISSFLHAWLLSQVMLKLDS